MESPSLRFAKKIKESSVASCLIHFSRPAPDAKTFTKSTTDNRTMTPSKAIAFSERKLENPGGMS